jgi:hypothetical protein
MSRSLVFCTDRRGGLCLAAGALASALVSGVRAEDWPDPLAVTGSRAVELEVGIEGDGTGANGGFANVDVPVITRDTLHFALGYTNFDDFTVRGPNGRRVFLQSEPAKQYVIDYRHGFDTVGLDFGFERWGNEDLLLIDDYSLGFDYQTTNSDWSFDLIRRASSVTLRALPGGPRQGDVNAWGFSGGFGYLTDPVDMYLSLMYFDYGDDLDSGPLALQIGTVSPFAVGNTLVERSALIGARHQFALWSVGMEGAWYRGGIGSNETVTLAALFDVAVSDQVDLSFQVGAVRGEDDDAAAYGVVSLRYAFGGGG